MSERSKNEDKPVSSPNALITASTIPKVDRLSWVFGADGIYHVKEIADHFPPIDPGKSDPVELGHLLLMESRSHLLVNAAKKIALLRKSLAANTVGVPIDSLYPPVGLQLWIAEKYNRLVREKEGFTNDWLIKYKYVTFNDDMLISHSVLNGGLFFVRSWINENQPPLDQNSTVLDALDLYIEAEMKAKVLKPKT